MLFLRDYDAIAQACDGTADLEDEFGLEQVHLYVIYGIVVSVVLELLPYVMRRAYRACVAFSGKYESSTTYPAEYAKLTTGKQVASEVAADATEAVQGCYVHRSNCSLGSEHDLMIGHCGFMAAVATADGLQDCVGFTVEGNAFHTGFSGSRDVHFKSHDAAAFLQQMPGSHVFLKRNAENLLVGERLDESDREELLHTSMERQSESV